jgi:transposase-like protein
MAKHRVHSIEFKRQVVQAFLSGETYYGLSRRHSLCRNLIRTWVARFQAGELEEDGPLDGRANASEARIAALERLAGRQALEIEFLRGALKSAPRPKGAPISVIAGPAASPSRKDAG